MVKPSTLFVFHLQQTMEMMKKISMKKSSVAAQKSPMLLTAAGAKPWIKERRSHGSGRLLNEVTWGQKQTNKQLTVCSADICF